MKKSIRILAMLLMVVLVFSAIMPAYAQTANASGTRADNTTNCGLSRNDDGTYRLWGCVNSITSSNLSIVIKLYTSSGSLVTSCSKSTVGTYLYKNKNVNIPSGSYVVKAVGSINGVEHQTEKTVYVP